MLTFLKKRRFCLIGTVESRTQIVNDKDEEIPGGLRVGYFYLWTSRSGRRKFTKSGNFGSSPKAHDVERQVIIWENGGGLPKDFVSVDLPRPSAEVVKFPVIRGAKSE